METRSNHILVGGVVLALIAAVLIFTVWIARLSGPNNQEYDIFFKTSVDGLAKGSAVTFSGVPSGQVKDISLMPQQPEFVRVRISVDSKTPVLQGTTATIASVGFTGVSQINLNGAMRGAPRIACPTDDASAQCPFGVPVIPTKPGALGELLNSAPKLLEQLSTLTDRLGQMLDDRNQKSVRNILANVDRLSGSLADDAPQIRALLADTRVTIRNTGDAAQQISQLAASANTSVGPAMESLKHATASAERSMNALEGAVNDARPGIKSFSAQTIPEVSQLVRNLNDMAEALTDVANKIDRGGAGAVIGGGRLPDYKPRR